MGNLQEIKIEMIHAREVLDSRGFPTVEAEVIASNGKGDEVFASAIVPSGASTGEGEALELRDGDNKRFLGKGVQKAVGFVRNELAKAVVGRKFPSQNLFDDFLLELDGTDTKSKFGANSILSLSMAFARAQATISGLDLYEAIREQSKGETLRLPVPLMNVINGGKHADNGLAIQEFMLVPAGFSSFADALRSGVEVFHHLKKRLHKRGLSTAVGDEGGFAPAIAGENAHEQVLTLLMEAIDDAGYQAGKQIFLALDCAASEFLVPGASSHSVRYEFEGEPRSSSEMIEIYSKWCEKFPLVSIEDGLAEHDWSGFVQLTENLGNRLQIVGDDLFVTNPKFLQKGIEQKAGNSILIKLNQIGTVTETLQAMAMAKKAKFSQITSHRSGETEDTFIADLAVGTGCGQIKTGSASRTDRMAKYNRLLRIEERLHSANKARFDGIATFGRK